MSYHFKKFGEKKPFTSAVELSLKGFLNAQLSSLQHLRCLDPNANLEEVVCKEVKAFGINRDGLTKALSTLTLPLPPPPSSPPVESYVSKEGPKNTNKRVQGYCNSAAFSIHSSSSQYSLQGLPFDEFFYHFVEDSIASTYGKGWIRKYYLNY
jgi:hypothetical protein